MTTKPTTAEMLDAMQRTGWAKLSKEEKRMTLDRSIKNIDAMERFLENLADDSVITLDITGQLMRHASHISASLQVMVALLQSEVE